LWGGELGEKKGYLKERIEVLKKYSTGDFESRVFNVVLVTGELEKKKKQKKKN